MADGPHQTGRTRGRLGKRLGQEGLGGDPEGEDRIADTPEDTPASVRGG